MPSIYKHEIASLFQLEAVVAQSLEDLMVSSLMMAKGTVVLRRDGDTEGSKAPAGSHHDSE